MWKRKSLWRNTGTFAFADHLNAPIEHTKGEGEPQKELGPFKMFEEHQLLVSGQVINFFFIFINEIYTLYIDI